MFIINWLIAQLFYFTLVMYCRYKKQGDDEYVYIGKNENQLQAPFSESGDKYKLSFESDRKTKTAISKLKIMGRLLL